ncbi:ceramide-1-phosphate transfer protein isoform X2 [Callithrix jacchus]
MDDSETGFNLKVVLVSFKQCLNEKEEVLLDPYIASWKGLVRCVRRTCSLRALTCRVPYVVSASRWLPPALLPVCGCVFLNSLGAIFSFISKDVVSKLQIMERLRGGPQHEHYYTLQAMVAHELGSQLVDLERRSHHPESGCRTLLRLHRALHWLQLFLESLRTSPEDARTSVLCTDSYNASLAAYHPWIVRRAVTVAFCALPTRKVFLEAMNVGPPEQAVQMLGEATDRLIQSQKAGLGRQRKSASVQKSRGLRGMCGWR